MSSITLNLTSILAAALLCMGITDAVPSTNDIFVKDDVCDSGACTVELLQIATKETAKAKLVPNASVDYGVEIAPKECYIEFSDEQLEKPMNKLIEDHPNISRPCLFGSRTNSGEQCMIAMQQKNLSKITSFAQSLLDKAVKKDRMNFRSALDVSYKNGNRKQKIKQFTTRLRKMPSEDAFCHAMKWHKLDGNLIHHYDKFQKLVDDQCAVLLTKFPEAEHTSMMEMKKFMENWVLGELPTNMTKRSFKWKAAVECVMGMASCSMANCAANMCFINGEMKHGSECVGTQKE